VGTSKLNMLLNQQKIFILINLKVIMHLTYTINKGLNQGKKLYPHRNKEGFYIASFTRFKKNYVYVRTEEELLDLIKKGYKIRMSNPREGIPPSLVIINS
jgi:hypothetical protein